MEKSIKQRLIGAVTILSLAVIFLPVIFDGSGENSLPDIKFDTPAQPKLIFDQHFENLPDSGLSRVKRLSEELSLKDLDTGWLIQVGTYSQESNAKKQIAELIARGHLAKYRKVNTNNKSMYIVEIGPENDKQIIQEQAKDIESNLNLKVQIKRN